MTYATYSPEDNKLRLYSGARLDAEEYAKVKAAGFRWAPAQKLFVAPMWTPEREDLLIEMCGEIGDEDTALVDRAEERADRFETYSENRTKDAERAHQAVARIADGIPLGQPILIGHHSERHARRDAEKIENGMRKAVKMWDTAKYWESRAAGAIRHAKYKERPDVRARRIKTIEAELRKEIASFTPDPKTRPIMQHKWNAKPEDPEVPHVWCGQARGGHWVPQEHLAAIEARAQRWIAHCNNRLAYERAMLADSGASDLLDKKPRPKQLPLCNYQAPGGLRIENIYHRGEMMFYPQVEMTQAEYARISADYKGTSVVGNSHRVRTMVKHSLVCVFLTDSKVHDIPEAMEPTPRAPRPVPTYTPRPIEEPTPFDAMRESLKAGVQVVSTPQLFPTPPELAQRMVEYAKIQEGESILEPSAGTGNLIRAIKDTGIFGVNVLAIEISATLCGVLRTVYPVTNGDTWNGSAVEVMQADFLNMPELNAKFDVILMNPPFENAADIKHIQHARSMLAPGGRLVAICANGSRQAAALQDEADTWEELEAGTFAGTQVRAVLLTMHRAIDNREPKPQNSEDVATNHGEKIMQDDTPAFASFADVEYGPRLDAERVTLEFATRSTRRVDGGRLSIEDSPLFGGPRQRGLFDQVSHE